jgi:signal transduction histidine kinase
MAVAQLHRAPETLTQFYSGRAVRLLATIRLLIALATCMLFVLTERVSLATAPLFLVIFWYLGFAAVVFSLSRRRSSLGTGWAVTAHLNDLIAFALLMVLTEGPLSPFFLFLILPMLGATIQWGWSGAVLTAAAVVIFYCTFILVAEPAPAEFRRILLRAVYLGATAGMLTYLGIRLQRLHRDVLRLAFYPSAEVLERRDAVCRASGIFAGAKIVLLIREDGKLVEITCPDGVPSERILPEADRQAIVHPDLEDRDFLAKTARRSTGERMVLFWDKDRLRRWNGVALGPDLLTAGTGEAICVRVRSMRSTGRLLILDLPDATTDHLAIATVVGTEIGLVLDRREMMVQVSRAVALEERMRLARDLHDGVLQVFTSLSLQIERALRDLGPGSQQASGWLRKLQSNIEADQAELRRYIQQLRDMEHFTSLPLGSDVRAALAELATRLHRRWGLQVNVSAGADLDRIKPAAAYQISWLLAAAAANAVKHGQATRLDCHVDFADGTIQLRIRDDGHGFYERCDATQSKSKWLGPRSLKDRVAEMGGKLAVRSDEGGTELSISMTLNENTR